MIYENILDFAGSISQEKALMGLDLGSKTNVNFKEILEYGLQYKDSNRNTLGRITSKLFCLRYIEVFENISRRGMWSEFLSCLYYGAKKEFGDKNGPFIKIY